MNMSNLVLTQLYLPVHGTQYSVNPYTQYIIVDESGMCLVLYGVLHAHIL